MLLNLSDEVMLEVAKEAGAVEVWAKLESLYVTNGMNYRLYLLRRMH